MKMHYLTVDGMLSGSGIRDAVNGGYIQHTDLGVSPELSDRIEYWIARYQNSHYNQFEDAKEVAELDVEGLEICVILQNEFPDAKIDYFSSAKMSPLTNVATRVSSRY